MSKPLPDSAAALPWPPDPTGGVLPPEVAEAISRDIRGPEVPPELSRAMRVPELPPGLTDHIRGPQLPEHLSRQLSAELKRASSVPVAGPPLFHNQEN